MFSEFLDMVRVDLSDVIIVIQIESLGAVLTITFVFRR